MVTDAETFPCPFRGGSSYLLIFFSVKKETFPTPCSLLIPPLKIKRRKHFKQGLELGKTGSPVGLAKRSAVGGGLPESVGWGCPALLRVGRGDSLQVAQALSLTAGPLHVLPLLLGLRFHPGCIPLAGSCSSCWSQHRGCFFQEALPHPSPAPQASPVIAGITR